MKNKRLSYSPHHKVKCLWENEVPCKKRMYWFWGRILSSCDSPVLSRSPIIPKNFLPTLKWNILLCLAPGKTFWCNGVITLYVHISLPHTATVLKKQDDFTQPSQIRRQMPKAKGNGGGGGKQIPYTEIWLWLGANIPLSEPLKLLLQR